MGGLQMLRSVMTTIRQMKNLEKRLSASMIQNIGPDTKPEPLLQKENADPGKGWSLEVEGISHERCSICY